MTVMTKDELCSSFDKGSLGIYHVKRFWERSSAAAKGLIKNSKDEWNLDLIIIDRLNLGIEETISKVYQFNNSLEDFEKWIVSKNNGHIAPGLIEEINSTLELCINNDNIDKVVSGSESIEKILNTESIDFWNENGYIIVKEAVPEEDCTAAENAIWDFLEMDPADPGTWYKNHPRRQGIMVQFFDHPALEKTRNNSKIKKAFAQLWNNNNIVVSHDRVSFNPPENSQWHFPGPRMHWDTSLKTPIPLGLQGILYLTDTEPEQGAFTCVPGFHNRIDKWLSELPEGESPRNQDLEALGAIPIAAKRGDFILWHHALPHGSRPNRTDKPRIVHYIKWYPPNLTDNREWV